MKLRSDNTSRILTVLSIFAIALAIIWELRSELADLRAHRAAVVDVENFIYQQYPTIDAATRRGHAEILIEATTGKCAEIAENAFACPGYGITKVAPIVRQYAAQAHGLKP